MKKNHGAKRYANDRQWVDQSNAGKAARAKARAREAERKARLERTPLGRFVLKNGLPDDLFEAGVIASWTCTQPHRRRTIPAARGSGG